MGFKLIQLRPDQELTSPVEGMEHQEGVGTTPSEQEHMEEGSSSLAHGNWNSGKLDVKELIENFLSKFPEIQLPATPSNDKHITKDHLDAVQTAKGILTDTVDLVGDLEKHIANHLKMEQKLLKQGMSQSVVDSIDKVLPLAQLWLLEDDSNKDSNISGYTEIQCEVCGKTNRMTKEHWPSCDPRKKGSDKRKDKGPGNQGYKGRHPMPRGPSLTTTGSAIPLSKSDPEQPCLPPEPTQQSPMLSGMPLRPPLTKPLPPEPMFQTTWHNGFPVIRLRDGYNMTPARTYMIGNVSLPSVTPSSNPRPMQNSLTPQPNLTTYQWGSARSATGLENPPSTVQPEDISAGLAVSHPEDLN
ncbi:unnamed protein product [Rhizoctonia solani]|uniref:Uncharacterized protein n=1 Tax=Rhizoctonia solani TaxID=456999 RepID=A0A8H2WI67_9AGAM|nr:unnamed protein product [Rhizoctonia solani]